MEALELEGQARIHSKENFKLYFDVSFLWPSTHLLTLNAENLRLLHCAFEEVLDKVEGKEPTMYTSLMGMKKQYL